MNETEPKGITVEEFERLQVVKASDLGMITGIPKFNEVYDVSRAVKMCLANYEDRREPVYGRLHLMMNTAALPGGQAVLASVDQGQVITWAGGVTA